MENIALIDVDSKIPNIALMKLSAYHKVKGDEVEWWKGVLFHKRYDRVYASKIFTFTQMPYELPKDVEIGGSGCNLDKKLPDYIENLMPDYSIYPDCKNSIGFVTRGCIRKCGFCLVPEKEGSVKRVASIYSFWNKQHKGIILLDNNIFGIKDCFEQTAEQLIENKLKVDFNQGLDIRLLTDERAKILKKLKPLKQWRFSFDSLDYEDKFRAGAELLMANNISRQKICIYVLVGYNDNFDDVFKRINIIYNEYGFDPFVMLYRSLDNSNIIPQEYKEIKTITNLPSWKKYKQLARWVNHKAIFKSVKREDYSNKQKTRKR